VQSSTAPRKRTVVKGVHGLQTISSHVTMSAMGMGDASLRSASLLCFAYAEITAELIAADNACHVMVLASHRSALMLEFGLIW